jgi:hypothetical protein
MAQRELANLLAAAKMPNAHAIIVLALMASENWKKTAELAQVPPQSIPLINYLYFLARLLIHFLLHLWMPKSPFFVFKSSKL